MSASHASVRRELLMLDGCTPWPEEFARRYRAEGCWQDITIGQMLDRTAARVPERMAVIDGAKSATYRQLVERSDRLAAQFAALGLKARDRVVFQLPNSIELLYAFFALLRIGVIPVMALPAHRRSELEHFAGHAEAVAHLIPAPDARMDYLQLAREVQGAAPTLRWVIAADLPARDTGAASGRPAGRMDDAGIGMGDAASGTGDAAIAGGTGAEPMAGVVSLAAMLAAEVDEEAVARVRREAFGDAGDVALMILSGGTTARSKFIPRTHNDYVYNCRQSGAVAGFDESTVYLAVLPMAHGYTLSSPGMLATFAVGGTVIVAPDIRAETVFPLIEKHRVTVLAAGVPLVVAWLASPWPERADLSSLKICMNGGSRLLPELRRQVEERLACTYIESYGAGEGLLNQTRPDDPEEIRFNSSGRPVSPADEVRVVDPDGNEVPEGEIGELQVRGPYTVRGYYRAPELTAAAFTADGFYRMGDAVRRIGDYLYLEGRLKDLINRGGEKVSVEEVENHIVAHPAVSDVCVVAMPDPKYGEKACAFVIAKAGETITFEELQSFLLARGIARFKLPERLEVVDAFPLSPAGKVLRRELRGMIADRLQAEPVAKITADR